MSAQATIFAALDTRMAAFTPATPIAWPNVSFTPGTASRLQVYHLPARASRRSIGLNGQNAYPGVYQVTVSTPDGGGGGAAYELADLVANWFPIGSVYGGVRIVSVSCSPALSSPGWFSVPVSITYELITSA